jgi:predicted Fe-S protein YdhL (DUF1289 family)
VDDAGPGQDEAMQVTESPCVQVCSIHQPSGLCLGCGRSLDEISRWAEMVPDERRRVMDSLPARVAAAALPPPPQAVRTGRRRLRERP